MRQDIEFIFLCLFIFTDETPSVHTLSRTKTSVSTDFQFSRCTVQQLSNVFHYDYEYLGPDNKLVLTPLTERAFLSLTQALKNFHCGTLIGPPGTGKSETVKDLSKVCLCACFNFSSSTWYKYSYNYLLQMY